MYLSNGGDIESIKDLAYEFIDNNLLENIYTDTLDDYKDLIDTEKKNDDEKKLFETVNEIVINETKEEELIEERIETNTELKKDEEVTDDYILKSKKKKKRTKQQIENYKKYLETKEELQKKEIIASESKKME